MAQQFQQETLTIAKDAKPQLLPGGEEQWKPGDAPSQAVTWAVKAVAKAGMLVIVGVYPQPDRFFPIGAAMKKNLMVNMGSCNHRTYIPNLVEMVEGGTVDPTVVLSHVGPMSDVIEAYRKLDLRCPGWIRVELKPGG